MIATEDYKVKLPVFEGPLDLLLHLLKVNEMDIYEVPIAKITEQYLSYLRLMETLDLEVAGEFLVMAATLVNIKLRSLLPVSSEDEEEEEEIDDILTAQMLMGKLVEYRKFKEAAGDLRTRERRRADAFVRDVALPKMAAAREDEQIQGDIDKLLQAFGRVLRFVEMRGWHMVTEEEFSTEEKMDIIESRLAHEGRLEIETVFRECQSKIEMIVCLLAVLELFHERRARIEQSELFGPIYLFPPAEKVDELLDSADASEEEASAADTESGEDQAADIAVGAEIVEISADPEGDPESNPT